MKRSDWTLLAIAAAGGDALSPVQLQKTLFLVGREFAGDVGSDFYTFEPYNYGPFDSSIYADAERLWAQGLIAKVTVQGRSWTSYSATPEGLHQAKVLGAEPSARVIRYLEAVVAWAQKLSFDQLVRAIYHAYPETKARSIFRG